MEPSLVSFLETWCGARISNRDKPKARIPSACADMWNSYLTLFGLWLCFFVPLVIAERDHIQGNLTTVLAFIGTVGAALIIWLLGTGLTTACHCYEEYDIHIPAREELQELTTNVFTIEGPSPEEDQVHLDVAKEEKES